MIQAAGHISDSSDEAQIKDLRMAEGVLRFFEGFRLRGFGFWV